MFPRIRELLAEAFVGDLSEKHSQELATEIVEYGRMNPIAPDIVIVNVWVVAHRLRASPRHVRQSLRLLEERGAAHRTHVKDEWELSA